MNARSLLGLLLATLVTATLLGSLALRSADAAPAPAAYVDPENDYPHLPKECADRERLIPLEPLKCHLNRFDRTRPTIVLWGDSHAWQLVPALRQQVKGRDVNLVAFMLGSCPVMHNPMTEERRRKAPDCLRSNAKALDYVRRLKQNDREFRVVLATYWQRYLKAIEERKFGTYHGQMAAYFEKGGPRLFRTLGRMGVPVEVVGQAVTVPERAPACAAGEDPYACDLPRWQAIREEKRTRAWVQGQMRSLVEPSYVDINLMCTRRTCYARGPGGMYTFFDIYHITASMSRQVSVVFRATVDRAGGTPLTSRGLG